MLSFPISLPNPFTMYPFVTSSGILHYNVEINVAWPNIFHSNIRAFKIKLDLSIDKSRHTISAARIYSVDLIVKITSGPLTCRWKST
jgi:hypothetical protein